MPVRIETKVWTIVSVPAENWADANERKIIGTHPHISASSSMRKTHGKMRWIHLKEENHERAYRETQQEHINSMKCPRRENEAQARQHDICFSLSNWSSERQCVTELRWGVWEDLKNKRCSVNIILALLRVVKYDVISTWTDRGDWREVDKLERHLIWPYMIMWEVPVRRWCRHEIFLFANKVTKNNTYPSRVEIVNWNKNCS